MEINNPISHAEQEVMDSLAQLESKGVLQPKNRMDLRELLNPKGEQDLDDISDEEIFEAVLSMQDTEQETIEIDVAVDKRPSRKEAIAASLTLQAYLKEINKPFARQLEARLASFGRQTHLDQFQVMHNTQITDYFTQQSDRVI